MRADALANADAALTWRKSSYSGADNGDCVEMAHGLQGIVPVRDSKDPSQIIAFASEGWSRFLAGVRSGQLST
ncbi:DUF397 domain-containing protein [Streptomyces klenkii]|uniref:DUF397 domain-containing protein n=1 Tax=Streptomyces klenkii TaxID=1420899 RepID=A0A3B0A5Q7_9ACTN|nr:DUF397 domain-containing protein [Streptomyces klenkii]RKN55066.1 DUF397 domain-containing protein [Streptomyces klenkii]